MNFFCTVKLLLIVIFFRPIGLLFQPVLLVNIDFDEGDRFQRLYPDLGRGFGS